MESEQFNLDLEERHTIAKNLNRLMELRKATETKVAQELNIPVMTIRRLLSGETTDPRVFTLKTIADYFKVTIDTLIGGENIANEFISQSKPVFVPILNWDIVSKINEIDLTKWQDWLPVTVGKNEFFSKNSFALESRPSMYPRFQQGTIFVLAPELIPSDGDLVLVNLRENNELTLRELFIDPPEWQLHPVTQGASSLEFSKETHAIRAVVFLTLFYNRKLRSQG